MNLEPSLLPPAIVWLSWPVFVGLLALALRTATWHGLAANRLEPVFVGAIGCIGLLWTMRAGIHPGLELHLLGTTVLTLVFGWRLAMLAAAAALAVLSATSLYHGWEAFAANGLLVAVLPVWLTHLTGRYVYRLLPHNFFIYIFVVAFFGAMLAMGAVISASAGLLLAAGAYPPDIILRDYLAMTPLLLFPEGFLSGMVMTMLVVFRPAWVRTFDDRDYVDNK